MWEAVAAKAAGEFGGGLGKGLGNGLGSAIGGETGPMISAATSGAYGNMFDASGWIVNMGSGTQNATANNAPKSPSYTDAATGLPLIGGMASGGGSMLAGLGGLPMLLLLSAAAVMILKRKG